MSAWWLLLIPAAPLLSLRVLDWMVRALWRRDATLRLSEVEGLGPLWIRRATGLCALFDANAITIGRTILYGSSDNPRRTLAHEAVHVSQWERARLPIVFIIGYLWHIRKGKASPYEAPAYAEGARHTHGH